MRRSFTLIELIMVLVIISFLSVASFKAVSALIVRSYKAKELTRLSLESQIALDQISTLLQERVPASVIGYKPSTGDFKYIQEIGDSEYYEVMEWIGVAYEEYSEGNYTGFADMRPSIKTDDTIATYTNLSGNDYALIFAGAFDRGFPGQSDFNDSFGWHGYESNDTFDIAFDSDGNITITDSVKPKWIYEKYYLVRSAYALARGEDINKNADCLEDLNVDDDTLLLFYDYKPWRGETFCADPGSAGSKSGSATILATHIAGFDAKEQDYTLRLILDINESIKGGYPPIHFSKMKVVF